MELRHEATREGRLSSFLLGELNMSAGLMNKLKWGDAIRVNNTPRHTDFSVRPGDVITVRLDEQKPEYPAEDGALTVLFEDEHILLVDKPAGMLIHPSRSQFSGTLANLVAGYYAKTGQNSAFHPVTRLDRDTFGIVLLAKNAHIHSLLQQAGIRKTYHALTFFGPESDSGTIDAPIARRPLPSLLRCVSPEGKPSVTEYQVLVRSGKLCKLSLRPITGRTHQLRLHCAHMGFPILGDPQYNSPESAALSAEMGLKSQLLCAYSLEFAHPITGEILRITSKMDVN
ncbi:MAG: RluA family pseudouridine synthase [Oscillospiraceae bacterium]|nr:RluA family pseudouridine synthase [Oscillospiraceae bacterium]